MADGAHHTQMSAMHADGRPEAPAGNTETARAIRNGAIRTRNSLYRTVRA